MPAESTPLTQTGDQSETGRVVGKNAWQPGCADCPFAFLFVANITFAIVFFSIWVGTGAPGWPDDRTVGTALTASGLNNQTMAVLTDASVYTFGYGVIFSLIWALLFIGIMYIAAFCLVISLSLLSVALFFLMGFLCLNAALNCRQWAGEGQRCTDDYQLWASVSTVVGFTLGALLLLWLICIWERLRFSAKMLSLVSGVLAVCPGTVLVACGMAVLTMVWWVVWFGAYMQANIYAAGGVNHSLTFSTWIGVLLGMLIVAWWGHKVFVNIAHMTACHVICSWYFDPDSINEGHIACCKPVTMTGFKRACTNYLGSVAFGSLIVAILEAIYYTCKIIADRVAANGGCLLQLICCCFICVLNCLKNCIEWLTEWAYCYIVRVAPPLPGRALLAWPAPGPPFISPPSRHAPASLTFSPTSRHAPASLTLPAASEPSSPLLLSSLQHVPFSSTSPPQALYGVGFTSAGSKVFRMLSDSGIGAVAQSTLVGPVLWLGCLCGAGVGVGAGYLTLQSHKISADYGWTQPCFGALIGFVVSSVVFSCVDAGNKAIYVCFVDDPRLMEMRDRAPEIKAHLESSQFYKKSKQRSYDKPSLVQP